MKVFVDTTVLTDLFLKPSKRQRVLDALNSCEESILPVFAIKEFKRGPLRYFVWLHNKLADTDSLALTLEAIQRLSRTPQRYLTSTAIEALTEESKVLGQLTIENLRLGQRELEKYGRDATLDSILNDRFRIALKSRILLAWRQRRKHFTSIWPELACYPEQKPKEVRGRLDLNPKRCDKGQPCRVAEVATRSLGTTKALLAAVMSAPHSGERDRRRKALRKLVRTPKRRFHDDECWHLGDAAFALLCPANASILTTNIKDHRPLAASLDKTALTPDDLLGSQ